MEIERSESLIADGRWNIGTSDNPQSPSINKYYVLDLQPGRSLVAYLLDQGFDVWIVDWGEPGSWTTAT